MNIEQRRAELRQRLLVNRYPRRANATFTEENDHNPVILQDCPRCQGTGAACEQRDEEDETQLYARFECPDCLGNGITGETERYFENERAPIEATPSAVGWLKCPCCGWRFSLADPNAWTGQRHKRCGQRISVSKPCE